ncbi:YheC/YheD family protein [Bacillus suaedaesalsae]|uniref:YheC/YheD family protein n=1 Tax=Bacillus suaedaesalsae TaxID=2810349 RepID=A0ABS2DIB7_9BACI|nr:YheC/YheD family protein [Bacillus suaedaesalsae]MBM6618234.1 YheC/YheD family protein [Bacillus suaedaesalsae]
MKNTMGIFISKRKYQHLLDGRSYSSNYFYEQGANDCNLSICYVTLNDLSLEKTENVKALLYDKDEEKYKEKLIPLPRVVYNRVSQKSQRIRDKLKQLINLGYYVFNALPFKNGKFIMNQLLEKNAEIASHLPKTLEATESNIKRMMNQFNKLFIKPFYSSIGKGIMYMEKVENGDWILHFRDDKQKWHQTKFTYTIPAHVLKAISQRPYVVQERIPLATYDGRSFDTRVIVQKNETGNWGITGMVGKLAQKGHVITNVGMGGDFSDIVTYLSMNPTFSPEEICKSIEDLALKIAHELEKYSYHIADLGMDIGIAEDGKPYFIECNFRSQYSGMEKDPSLEEVCKSLYANPIRYGSFLLRKMNEI